MSIGNSIRQFFRELLGSRVAEELKQVLEHERDSALQLRMDYERRLQDKDAAIADLRGDLLQAAAKIAQYELVLIPLANPAGRALLQGREKPDFETISSAATSSWAQEQDSWYRQQEREAQAEREAQTKE